MPAKHIKIAYSSPRTTEQNDEEFDERDLQKDTYIKYICSPFPPFGSMLYCMLHRVVVADESTLTLVPGI